MRTPMALQTSVISDHMSVPQGLTAPSSILSDSSGTRLARLTVTAIPVPPHVGQAPELLKEKSSALGASNSTPQTGHLSFWPRATAGVGGR